MGEGITIGRARRRRLRMRLLATLAGAVAVFATAAAAAAAVGSHGLGYARVQSACPAPRPSEASCFALVRRPAPASEAGQPGVRPFALDTGAASAGPAGGLTPSQLASAYGYDPSLGGAGQTVAIVDAFDDPSIEADLEAFDANYGLPACTHANGCFTKVGQTGETGTLPAADTGGWSIEISLDVEAVHAACHSCKILLVEANNPEFANLAAATNEAVAMGANEVSNSYGGPEGKLAAVESAYKHPGVVIAASTGDSGWDSWTRFNQLIVPPVPPRPNVPASLPTVVAVGGTSLTLNAEGKRLDEKVWNGNGPHDVVGSEGATGGGCSLLFSAQTWQQAAPGYGSAGCGSGRLDADVAAVADPLSGFDIYDTYKCGPSCEYVTGKKWVTIGGTSLSAPLVTGMFGLAGGSHSIGYPALTLYGHLGGADLFDVASGGNGYCDVGGLACGVNREVEELALVEPVLTGVKLDCEGKTSCNAGAGFDGPSGVGAPSSIALFEPLQPSAAITAPAVLQAGVPGIFSAVSSHDPYPGAAPSYSWNWGDGTAATASTATGLSHTFATPGNYLVTLTTADVYGFKSPPATTAVNVEPYVAPSQPSPVPAHGVLPFTSAPAPKPNVLLRGSTLQVAPNGTVVLSLSCPAGETACEGTVTLRTLGAVSAAAKPSVLTLASGHFKLAGGKVASVTFHLRPKAMRLLVRKHSLRVRVQIAAHDPSGATAANAATALLRAPRKHH